MKKHPAHAKSVGANKAPKVSNKADELSQSDLSQVTGGKPSIGDMVVTKRADSASSIFFTTK
jgi:hypothetical protein